MMQTKSYYIKQLKESEERNTALVKTLAEEVERRRSAESRLALFRTAVEEKDKVIDTMHRQLNALASTWWWRWLGAPLLRKLEG